MTTHTPRVLTLDQVGEALAISHDQALALINSGALIATNVSAGTRRPRLRVSVKELERFIEARTIKPPRLAANPRPAGSPR